MVAWLVRVLNPLNTVVFCPLSASIILRGYILLPTIVTLWEKLLRVLMIFHAYSKTGGVSVRRLFSALV